MNLTPTKTTFGHVVAYVTAGLAIVASLSPSSTAAVLSAVGLGSWASLAPAIIATAGGLVALLHNVGALSAPKEAAKSLLVVGALLLGSFCSTGCVTKPLPGVAPTQQQLLVQTGYSVLAEAAVGVAVSKGANPSQIADLAGQLQAFVTGAAVTVPALTQELRTLEAKANLNVAQSLAINTLFMALDVIIAQQMQSGALPANASTTAGAFLGDIATAAQLFGAPAPPPSAVKPAPAAAPAVSPMVRGTGHTAALQRLPGLTVRDVHPGPHRLDPAIVTWTNCKAGEYLRPDGSCTDGPHVVEPIAVALPRHRPQAHPVETYAQQRPGLGLVPTAYAAGFVEPRQDRSGGRPGPWPPVICATLAAFAAFALRRKLTGPGGALLTLLGALLGAIVG